MLRISFDGLLAQTALESFLDCLEKVELMASSGRLFSYDIDCCTDIWP